MSEQALLDAIIANPDDDAPRLVYADLLEGRGDPRGEFIQLQCRADQTAETLARQTELERAHASTWLAPLIALKVGAQFAMRRGFVDAIQGRFPSVVDRAAEIAAHAPLLASAVLGVGGQLDRDRLAHPRRSPILARLRHLHVRGKHRGETRGMRGPIADVRELTEMPLAHLRSLRLEALRIKPDELRAFIGSLPALDTLALHLNLPPDEAARVMPHLASLRALDLSYNHIDGATFAAWLARDYTRLETLALDSTRLGAREIARLVETAMPALRHLSLAHTAVDADVARALAAWTAARIDLRGTQASQDLIDALGARATS
jgi:uncharacterized protein (TIGR02996 family)